MYLAKVVGTVVCSVKNDKLAGKKLLLVQRLPEGAITVALDSVGAGTGETVYVCRGKEASFAFLPEEVPTEATVVALVDYVDAPEDVEIIAASEAGEVIVAIPKPVASRAIKPVKGAR